ncbi:hypothetical protein Scep_030163 [Stephania cephalantha]|uniref:Uncharacterized protein n=1 Tax=Stephania cephalantha TaxID=152367 RepID=A0AAP0E2M6_9MAGN
MGLRVVDKHEIDVLKRRAQLRYLWDEEGRRLERDERGNGLKGFDLFRQQRLYIVSISEKTHERICEVGGGLEGEEAEDEVEESDRGGGSERAK